MTNTEFGKILNSIFEYNKKDKLSIKDIICTFNKMNINKNKTDIEEYKIKRKQVKNSCINCKKIHKKCDDNRPCQRCIDNKLINTCKDSERKKRDIGIKRGPYKKNENK